MKEEDLKDWLKPVMDPELNMSLVELGLIYSIKVEDKKAKVDMTLTSPGCPAGDYMVQMVKDRMNENESIDQTEVEIVWDPVWNPKDMASEEVKEVLGIW